MSEPTCLPADAAGDLAAVFGTLWHQAPLPPLMQAGVMEAAGVLRHCLAAIGPSLCCIRCGAYTFRQMLVLAGECRGRPADAAAAWRLQRMLGGKHPTSGLTLREAKRIDAAAEAFCIILSEPSV